MKTGSLRGISALRTLLAAGSSIALIAAATLLGLVVCAIERGLAACARALGRG